jgi:Ni/Co efflux regulator RcnB
MQGEARGPAAGGFRGQPGVEVRAPSDGARNFQNGGAPRGFAGDQRNAGLGGQRGGGGFTYHGRSFQSVHAAPFTYPSGFGYRRWGVGQRLPRLFLSPGYFINWSAYNLGPPAPGCEWVRYGPDALMVNRYTGQVVDVAYGVFY